MSAHAIVAPFKSNAIKKGQRMKRLPTLITLRSAEVLREEAMQFAYRKVGMHVGVLLAAVCMSISLHLALAGDSVGGVSIGLALVSPLLLGVAWYCGRTLSFPHCPRLTFAELDAMRNDMGLPAEVLEQTYDSVVVGSDEDWQSVKRAQVAAADAQQTGTS